MRGITYHSTEVLYRALPYLTYGTATSSFYNSLYLPIQTNAFSKHLSNRGRSRLISSSSSPEPIMAGSLDPPQSGTRQDVEKLKTWFIGAIDQGTTSTRFLIFDGTGSPIASHQMEFKQMYPHSGSVQDYQHQLLAQ